MILVKTKAGQQALKNRHGALAPRQRPAFILFDGKRSVEQVLAAMQAMGLTMDDVQAMVGQGLLEEVAPQAQAVQPEAAAPRSAAERYQAAYLVATELTASLGLRGFRLNLAVEAATGYEQLVALAPRIREAVGDAKYERLNRALLG